MLRATVHSVTGKAKHFVGTIHDGHAIRDIEIAHPTYLTIVEGDNGYYLFQYTNSNVCLADSWFETLDGAFTQAEFEFEVHRDDWLNIDSGCI